MSDLIRREDAYAAIRGLTRHIDRIAAIRALPAVQPENDNLVKHMTGLIAAGLDRIEQLTAERDDAKLRIEALTVDRAEARAGWHKYEGAWMTAEGKLSDAESDIAHLHKLLAEAASDLTAYVDAEYPPETCAQYPDIARRHHRDMDLVRRIEAELKGETP